MWCPAYVHILTLANAKTIHPSVVDFYLQKTICTFKNKSPHHQLSVHYLSSMHSRGTTFPFNFDTLLAKTFQPLDKMSIVKHPVLFLFVDSADLLLVVFDYEKSEIAFYGRTKGSQSIPGWEEEEDQVVGRLLELWPMVARAFQWTRMNSPKVFNKHWTNSIVS
jgi:hypothetical protein